MTRTPDAGAGARRWGGAADGVAVALVALAVRAWVFHDARTAPFWRVPLIDESAYLELARRLAAGEPPPSGAWYVAPGYAYILSAFDVAGLGPLAVKLAQLAAGVVSAWCVWRLTRSWCGRAAAFAAGVTMAILPAALLQELLLLKTTFATTALLLALVWAMPGAAARARSRARTGVRALAVGLALGAATLLRGELVAVVVALSAAALVAAARGWPGAPPRAATCAVALVVAAMIAVPTVQNARWSGDFVPLAFGGGVNFYIGNHAGADGSYVPLRPDRSDPPQEEADAVDGASRALGGPARPSEVSRYWFRRGLAWWRDEPLAALGMTARKWVLVWGPHELADTVSTAQAGRWVAALRTPIANAATVLPLAAVGLWLARRRRELWPLYAFVAGAQLAIVPFFVFDRFRLHLLAACIPFAAFAVERGVRALCRRRFAAVATGALAAAIVALATAAVRVPRDEAVLRVNVGELLFQAGRYDEALVEFEAVRASSPAAWRVDINIANVEAARGRDVAALAALERVLARLHDEAATSGQPSREELAACHTRAGDLELRRRNPAGAVHHYRQALPYADAGTASQLRARLAALITAP